MTLHRCPRPHCGGTLAPGVDGDTCMLCGRTFDDGKHHRLPLPTQVYAGEMGRQRHSRGTWSGTYAREWS